MSLILDGSLTLAWCLPDEESDANEVLRWRVAESGAMAPNIWRLEVANGLLIAVRRERMSVEASNAALASLEEMAIETDTLGSALAWSTTFDLARRHRLTAYDASYLELALRRRLPLATLDTALARAAIAEGVTVLP